MKKALLLSVLMFALLMCFVSCNQKGTQSPNNEHTHKFGEWSVTKNATCTEDGVKNRYCDCGEKQSDAIPTIDHTEQILVAKESTCTEKGLTEGKKCSNCGEILVAQQDTPLKAHTKEIIPAVESTCNKKGLTEGKKCSVCGDTLIAQQDAPLKAHTEEIIPAVESTCTNKGLTEGKKCSVCGEVLIAQQEAPIEAHTEVVDKAVLATCTKTGLSEGKHCSKCGITIVAQQIIPVIAHTYDDKYDDTCNKCGFVRVAECAHRETETIFGYEATCTAIGLTNGTKCKKCGEVLVAQNVISVKEHTEVQDKAVAATCTNSGLTLGKHCSACGIVIVAQVVVPAKEHTEVEDPAVLATCTSTGLTAGKHCSVCNEILVAQNTVSIKPHTEVIDYAVAATCTSIGLTAGKHCSVCAEVLVEQRVIDAIGHNYYDWKCINCDKKYSSQGLKYILSSDGSYYILSGIGSCTDNEIIVADMIDNIPVKKIGNGAFANCSYLSVVVITENIVYIDQSAFVNCPNLNICCIAESQPAGWNKNWNPNNISVVWGYVMPTAVNEFTWKINGESVTITGYKGNRSTVITPMFIEGLPVTAIDEFAFYGNNSFERFVISEGVTTIGTSAFNGCEKLLSISLPSSLKSLGACAFGYCDNLRAAEIPYGCERINDWCFMACEKLHAVVISETVSFIGQNTFYETNNVTAFCEAAEGKYTHLNAAAVWNYNPTDFNDFSFSQYTEDVTINGYTGNERDIVIPATINGLPVITINDFSSETDLHSLVILDGTVVEIWNSGFGNCRIENIVIGDKVTYMPNNAFANSTDLISISVSEKNPVYKDIGGNLYTKDGKTLIKYATGKNSKVFAIPDGVISIGSHAFTRSYNLSSVIIPDDLISIDLYAFEDTSINFNEYSSAYYLGTADNPYAMLVSVKSKDVVNCIIHKDTKHIAAEAFDGCSYLTSIDLPDSLVSIGAYAFSGCEKIQNIVLPDSIMHIGRYAFGYTALNYNVYDNAYYLGDENNPYLVLVSQDNSDIVSCKIHPDTKVLAESAFDGNYSLTEIYIPESVVSVGANCFGSGYSLTIYCEAGSEPYMWDSNWNSVDSPVVWNCSNNDVASDGEIYLVINDVRYAVRNGYAAVVRNSDQIVRAEILSTVYYLGVAYPVTMIDTGAFVGCRELISVTIPEGIVSIGDYAFYSCEKLTSIVIPDSVKTIGDSVFTDYSYGGSFTSIVIGSGLYSIGEDSFYAATKELLSFTVSENNKTYTAIDGNLYSKDGKTLIRYAGGKPDTEFVIPNTVTEISAYAFCGARNLTRIVVPSSVTKIGSWGLYIDEVTICCEAKCQPAGWSSDWCNNSPMVIWNYPNNDFTADGDTLFAVDGISYLIADGVAVVGKDQSNNMNVINIASEINYNGVTYPVVAIGDRAFYRCDNLTSVNIPDSIISIGASAFYECKSLTSVTVPDSVSIIGSSAFYGCSSLSSIVLPKNLTEISSSMFSRCVSLMSIVIPDGVASIKNQAFYGCSNLISITIPESVISIAIDDNAFYECDSLTSFNVSENNSVYKDIDGNLYSKDGEIFIYYAPGKSATDFIIPDDVTSIGSRAFYGSSRLTNVVLPDGLTSIGSYAFYECSSLASIFVPESVTNIGYSAFNSKAIVYFEIERELDGWYLDSNNAVWGYTGKTNTYYFELDGDGEYDDSISSDDFIILPILIKEGYSLVGWHVDSDFTDIELVPGTKYYSSSNCVLYAEWIPDVMGNTYGTSFEEALDVYDGTTVVNIDEPGKIFYYRYIAEESKTITISSQIYGEYYDTYVDLYDQRICHLAYNDDGSDANFYLNYDVVEGEVYFIVVRLCSSEETGKFILAIQ